MVGAILDMMNVKELVVEEGQRQEFAVERRSNAFPDCRTRSLTKRASASLMALSPCNTNDDGMLGGLGLTLVTFTFPPLEVLEGIIEHI